MGEKDVNSGQIIGAPTLPAVAGFHFDHWEPSDPDSTVATSNATFTAVYVDDQPDEDVPIRPDGDKDDPREYYAYPMDNTYQVYRPGKSTPVTSIRQWAPEGGGWWSGPIDGDGSDSPHGADNGMSAIVVDDRPSEVYNGVTYYTSGNASDTCVYEYARPTGTLPYYPGSGELLSDWTCPCYDANNNPIGNYAIHSDCDWIKFRITKPTGGVDGMANPPFTVVYWIAVNSGSSRKGTITMTTPGGTASGIPRSTASNAGKPYLTSSKVYIYQQGINEP